MLVSIVRHSRPSPNSYKKPSDDKTELRDQLRLAPVFTFRQTGKGIEKEQYGGDDQRSSQSTKADPQHPVGTRQSCFLYQLAYHKVNDSADDKCRDEQYRDSNPISNQFVFKARKPDRQVSVVMAGDKESTTPSHQR